MQQCERHWEERSYAMREIKKERKIEIENDCEE